jgi:serine/threonine protein kinase
MKKRHPSKVLAALRHAVVLFFCCKPIISPESEYAIHAMMFYFHGHEYCIHTLARSQLYIFLEYVAGGSMASMLERFGRFTEELASRYTRQLLHGLRYLHAARVVHRDLKVVHELSRRGVGGLGGGYAASLACRR